ncbi:hypothetical protein DOFOFD_09905 [Acetobacteraceae bacterium EV16P]|uniref:RNase H type-1 domain-containing protein n=1 Tax=Sorlinia euscelidii TaxID=3081148 RepID=A0ABU7U636_9PROT
MEETPRERPMVEAWTDGGCRPNPGPGGGGFFFALAARSGKYRAPTLTRPITVWK